MEIEEEKKSTTTWSSMVGVVLENPLTDSYDLYLFKGSKVEEEHEVEEIEEIEGPLMSINKETIPSSRTSFVAVPSSGKIYTAGGTFWDVTRVAMSNHVHSIDISSSPAHVSREPNLLSGKLSPILLCIGYKIYALSDSITTLERPEWCTYHNCTDNPPYFEFLDTSLPGSTWKPLPDPVFPPKGGGCYSVKRTIQAWAVCRTTILFSVKDAGTYGFDVNDPNAVWVRLSSDELPFYGLAQTIKNDDDYYYYHYGFSIKKHGALCAYRFNFNNNNNNNQGSLFTCVETGVVMPHCKSAFNHNHARGTYVAPYGEGSNKMYFVNVGFDHPPFYEQPEYIPEHRCRIAEVRLLELPAADDNNNNNDNAKDINLTAVKCFHHPNMDNDYYLPRAVFSMYLS